MIVVVTISKEVETLEELKKLEDIAVENDGHIIVHHSDTFRTLKHDDYLSFTRQNLKTLATEKKPIETKEVVS